MEILLENVFGNISWNWNKGWKWELLLTPKIPWDQKLVVFCLGSLCKDFILFFSFFFGWVNYIFHKLSVNTKHIQFRLRMSLWWSFVQNGYWVHFSCIFWGAPTCSHVAKTSQGLKGRVLRKKFVLSIESWVFTFFHFFSCSWFCMMSPSMWPLQSKFEVFDFFQEILQVPQCWSFESRPIKKNNSSSLIITNMEVRFEPCMLNLIWKWGAKDPKKKDDHLILSNFGIKKFTVKLINILFLSIVHFQRWCNLVEYWN
jgi:hypothetical protein